MPQRRLLNMNGAGWLGLTSITLFIFKQIGSHNLSIKQLDRQQTGSKSVEDIYQHFDVDPAEGLSSEEASKRLDQYGRNVLQEQESRGAGEIFIEQFRDVIIWLLVAAAADKDSLFDLFHGRPWDYRR